MTLTYISVKGVHGSGMCCNIEHEDFQVLKMHNISVETVSTQSCPNISSIGKLSSVLDHAKINEICANPNLSGQSSAQLCPSIVHFDPLRNERPNA